jgi:hypothetical protein
MSIYVNGVIAKIKSYLNLESVPSIVGKKNFQFASLNEPTKKYFYFYLYFSSKKN